MKASCLASSPILRPLSSISSRFEALRKDSASALPTDCRISTSTGLSRGIPGSAGMRGTCTGRLGPHGAWEWSRRGIVPVDRLLEYARCELLCDALGHRPPSRQLCSCHASMMTAMWSQPPEVLDAVHPEAIARIHLEHAFDEVAARIAYLDRPHPASAFS